MSLFRNLLIEKALELPSIYREVEYLYPSEKNVFVNTGFIMPEEGATIETEFLFPTYDGAASVIWGSRSQNSPYPGTIFYRYSGNKVSVLLSQYPATSIADAVTLPGGVMYHHKVEFYKNSFGSYCCVEYLNGVASKVVASATSYVQKAGEFPILLFCSNNNGTAGFFTTTAIKSFKVFSSDGVKVKDLVACVRKTDNEPGFFDKVGRRFLTNAASSGEFIYE